MTKREQFIELLAQYNAKGSENNLSMQLSLCRLFEHLFSAQVVFSNINDICVTTHDNINKNYMLIDIVDILRIHFGIVGNSDLDLVFVKEDKHRFIKDITARDFEQLLVEMDQNFIKNGSDYFYITVNKNEIIKVLFLGDKISLYYGSSPSISVYSLDQFSVLLTILNQI